MRGTATASIRKNDDEMKGQTERRPPEIRGQAGSEKRAAGDDQPPKKQPRFESLKFGVTWPREILKHWIDERLERRLNAGMTEEVRRILDQGVPKEFLLKLGLEYKYLTLFLSGEMTEDEMKEELGKAIKRFAKRQMTWFRKDPRIIWLEMDGDPIGQASRRIEQFLP